MNIERLELAIERIREIPYDENTNEVFHDFFIEISSFINMAFETHELINGEEFDKLDVDALKYIQSELYKGLEKEDYKESIYNPAFIAKNYSKELALPLSALAYEVRSIIQLLNEEKYESLSSILELFLEIYGMFGSGEEPGKKAIEEAIYWYAFDYLDISVEERVRDSFLPESRLKNIILHENLSEQKYLFKLGGYISDTELGTSEYLANLSEDKIKQMADAATDGFYKGFWLAKKDLKAKKTVGILYDFGFERLIKQIILNLKEEGLEAVLLPAPCRLTDKKPGRNSGCGSLSDNKQAEYDHRFDNAIFYDKAYVDRRLTELQLAYNKYEKEMKEYAGPIIIESFGEEGFEPVNNEYAYTLDEKQKKLSLSTSNKMAELQNSYIPRHEISYTIIAWPLPNIAKNKEEYKNIFDDIIKVNTLDFEIYQNMQQLIIDELDKADTVRVTGKAGNETDITVKLHELKDAKKETNFENCVADVNIPVGEVFTSPVLKGTNGLLHVKEVYIGDFQFKDLKLYFEDGMIKEYSCKNFDNEKESKKLIEEILLREHESLPMGEFAIGTNTTAYAVAKKYNIQKYFPILIAEKTGPHFAIGDTCYSYEEENMTYNPDGKAIVARDNEISSLRKENIEKAYFSCHTDITIPYDELGDIIAVTKDKEQIEIIKDGKFVLEGVKELNKPFSDMEK